ncbi:hypothetical protein [Bernardetia sp.]|uniref:hypothetical protein n=1 Tax=Bernardetia sp. TaxID=1937974 RepID=UPI0025B89AF7|nr:hypothetical protein [Bernardetia sp.]
MSYSVHRLNIKKHVHIVGRQDGVTGDTIKAGDEVVFCAACQSVFLKDSWEYMNRQHCRQTETLGFVPAPVPNLIAKKKEAKLIFETFSTFKNRILGLFAFSLIIASSCGWIYLLIFTNKFLPKFEHWVTFALYMVLLFLGVFGSIHLLTLLFGNKLFKKITGADKRSIKILENGIELRKDKTYLFYDIQKIVYTKNNMQNKLTLYLKNGEVIQHKCPKDEYEKTKDFLFGLVWVAQFVPTSVHLSNGQEFGMAKSIERNYTAQFSVLRIEKNAKS